MGETDLSSSNVGNDIIRTLLSMLDRPAYWLLGLVYELFFNVASADLFSNQTIMKFYGRVQVILGVFMMFQLSMSILKGIVNPDSFTGDKGAKSLITKIITALILLTVMMPISIPNPKNEYEIQINNNGLLFGTLYSLQNRILSNNTIGRLVLGTTDSSASFTASSGTNDNNLRKSARIFTSTIIKGFYRINLIPVEERDDTYLKEGKDPATYNDNRVCTDISDDILERYTRLDADPGDIISMVNETCEPEFSFANHILILRRFAGNKKYVFTYMPIISMIVAVIFIFVLLKFTIDVAVRAVKLAVLRLIAPIPIISYMDPNKSGDGGAFNAWVKALTSTYLDLFIRLAVVYFVIFLIQDMIVHGVVMDVGDGVLGVLSMIIIWIGLFMFANQAPKFIKQVLGMKDDGTGTLGSILGKGLSFGVAGAGVIGSARTNYRASKEENDVIHPGSRFNVFRNVGSSIAGAIGGGYAGFKAAGAKDATPRSVMDAQGQRNATRASHSTFPGRIADDVYGTFTGRSLADTGNKRMEATNKAAELIGKLKSKTEEEGVKNGAAVSALRDGSAIRIGGRTLTRFDGETFDQAMKGAQNGRFVYDGQTFEVAKISSLEVDEARKSQVQAWMNGGAAKSGGKTYATLSSGTEVLAPMITQVQSAVADADKSVKDAFDVSQIGSYGKALGAANVYAANTDAGSTPEGMRQARRNANKQKK